MKFIITTLVFLFFLVSTKAQNLINPGQWTVGSGSVRNFSQNGASSENIREWGEDPFGTRSLLWKAVPDSGNNGDGGWNTASFPIDHSKMYRFSVWVKKTNSYSGHTYLGCYCYPDYVLRLNGTSTNNPYFWHGDPPVLGKWYLLVGYIHASNDPSTSNYGGLYDGETGEKVIDFTDFKFPPTATSARHRPYLYYDTNTNDRQYFYAPRVDEVNGNEPSIAALLGIYNETQLSGDLSVDGNLGIKTTSSSEFPLAVNGKIRAKEVKVESDWADFVFKDDYQLMQLSDLEEFIQENGHLPKIPTEKEVEENGVSLGKMNSKLLQKIEELTLYMIEVNQRMELLEKENEELKKAMKSNH
ncbi:MAG: hypothetical protein N4A59_03930 [Marinifilum sp.]|jgi:hypothetical protein|nr:hypothetical protein [Marinifilum sp.]